MTRPVVRLLAVPAVLAVVAVRRPDLLTGAASSPRTLLAVGALVAAAVLTRRAVTRLRPGAAPWSGTVVLLLGIGLLLGPSLRERTVDEAFPTVALTDTLALPAVTPLPVTPLPVVPLPVVPRLATPLARTPAAATASPSTAHSRSATSSPATAPPRRLASAPLQGRGHRASGRVSLYRVGDRLVVRFEDVDLQGTPGPSVHLVLAGGRTPNSGLRLGRLTAEHGSFSYRLPAGTAHASWTVLVWCDPYATPIATAGLS